MVILRVKGVGGGAYAKNDFSSQVMAKMLISDIELEIAEFYLGCFGCPQKQ